MTQQSSLAKSQSYGSNANAAGTLVLSVLSISLLGCLWNIVECMNKDKRVYRMWLRSSLKQSVPDLAGV